jgi:hypothetical protein
MIIAITGILHFLIGFVVGVLIIKLIKSLTKKQKQ